MEVHQSILFKLSLLEHKARELNSRTPTNLSLGKKWHQGKSDLVLSYLGFKLTRYQQGKFYNIIFDRVRGFKLIGYQ